MRPPKSVTLPDVSPDEVMKLLAGLDELQGKHGRVLYDKIVGHVNQQIIQPKAKPPKAKAPKKPKEAKPAEAIP